MSMNGFFVAFTQQEIDAMKQDNALVDQWVWEEEKSSVSTDIETAWDILNQVLAGTGFDFDEHISDALSNGCSLISNNSVKNQAQKLSKWTHKQVLDKLQNLDADLYRVELYKNEPEDLLEQFDKLRAFYHEAAEKNLGAIFHVV